VRVLAGAERTSLSRPSAALRAGRFAAEVKRDGGFASQDAAKMAAREDAKTMKNMRQPDRPDVGRIMVGQNAEKATRY
jgi:hypothetical protein